MLQIYDRVVTSGSATTLVMLTIALLAAFLALAGLDLMRATILTRASVRLDRLLAARIVAASVETSQSGSSQSQPVRDFDTFRQVDHRHGHQCAVRPARGRPSTSPSSSSAAPLARLLRARFVPAARRHGDHQRISGARAKQADDLATADYNFTEISLRNSEVDRAMGMVDGPSSAAGGRPQPGAPASDASQRPRRPDVGGDRFLRLTMSRSSSASAPTGDRRQTTAGSMFVASISLGKASSPSNRSSASGATWSWRGGAERGGFQN